MFKNMIWISWPNAFKRWKVKEILLFPWIIIVFLYTQKTEIHERYQNAIALALVVFILYVYILKKKKDQIRLQTTDRDQLQYHSKPSLFYHVGKRKLSKFLGFFSHELAAKCDQCA